MFTPLGRASSMGGLDWGRTRHGWVGGWVWESPFLLFVEPISATVSCLHVVPVDALGMPTVGISLYDHRALG